MNVFIQVLGSDSIEELLGSGSEPTTSTKEWPRVFAAAMFQTGKNGQLKLCWADPASSHSDHSCRMLANVTAI